MPEPIKKTIPWFLILALLFSGIGLGFNFNLNPESSVAKAVGKTSEVTVGNSAPSFTISPAESPASTSTSPTNATTTLTFQATASDPNSEQYYLAICKTNSVTPVNGGVPTCGGGNWCISGATNSGSQASCNYQVQDADAESNTWYGFACDGNTSNALCSSADQGSGDSGSPFYVNSPPNFPDITQNPSANPGSNVTWTATASDGDSVYTQDQVKLFVCNTASWSTSTDACGGTQLCASAFVNSNPSCSYNIPIPTDDDASPYAAWVFLVDTHGFEAYDQKHYTNAQYTVNNVAPTVTGVKLNNEQNIDLTEGSTVNINIVGLLADNNGCADISTATSSAYATDVGYWSCTSQNDNNCYYNIAYSQLESCGGGSDTDRYATFTVAFWYHANPTGASTPWTSYNWEAAVIAKDDDAAYGKATSTAVVEMNDMIGMSLTQPTGNLSFGTLTPGQNTGTINVTSTVAATGNIALDTNMSGQGLVKSGGTAMIDIQNQKYSTTTTPYDNYTTGGATLTTSTVEFELELPKTTNHTNTSTDDIFWGLGIPTGVQTGTYYGTTTIAAVKDELNWP